MKHELRLRRMEKVLGAGSRPLYAYQVPGRVNLIGEHTDYNNCPVFPMAVDREILALVSPREDRTVRVRDVRPVFGEIEFAIDTKIQPFPVGSWGNYIKAGVQEAVITWKGLSDDVHSLRGFEMVIDSTIPPAAGMSSSSALVVLSAMVFLSINNIDVQTRVQRLELAELCARGERYTGTQGGGMDQAAILLGRAGHAMKIGFNPLSSMEAPIPSSHIIAVAHSTVHAPKTQSVMDAYNRRSIECRLAAALLASSAGKRFGIAGIGFIGDLVPEKTGLSRKEIESLVKEAVRQSPYRVEDIAADLGMSADEVVSAWCMRRDGSVFPEPSDGFHIHKRLTHVWNEWKRVEQTFDALKTGDIPRVGTLMNESHESCRDFHEISCRELDLLTEISRKSGAVGSRLTGAGFGGCTVNLVERERLEDYIGDVGRRFYRDAMNLEDWTEYLFIVEPTDGAGPIQYKRP